MKKLGYLSDIQAKDKKYLSYHQNGFLHEIKTALAEGPAILDRPIPNSDR